MHCEAMNLEEINNVEDKAERLRMLKDYVFRELKLRDEQNDRDFSHNEDSMRDERGGMMSTAAGKMH